jgi:phosphate transport system substrate-binding protein
MRTLLALSALACLTVGSNEARAEEKTIRGAGSSFIAPVMKKWTAAYEKAMEIKIEYQSVGSGSGIEKLIDKTIDFACTDAPLTKDQQKGAGEVVHIPLVMGAVVPAYNLEGVNKPVRFTGPVLADIFLGKITRWNDDRLKKLNPNIELPDQEITVVRRADASGTTYIWSSYLSKISSAWKDKVGKGLSLKWPLGRRARGNEGVAREIKDSKGTIGYVELTYALENKLTHGAIKNRDGKFVQASKESVTAAGQARLKETEDLCCSLIDASGKESYPVCGTTYAVFPMEKNNGKTKEIMSFLRWVTSEGQKLARGMHYAPLPKGFISLATKKLTLAKEE